MKSFPALMLAILVCTRGAAIEKETHEITGPNGNRVWVYLPDAKPKNDAVGCVIVPPAGTRLFHGIRLGDGDRAEHWPYVDRGFAVVSFDLSGDWADADDPLAQREALTRFLKAENGIRDARDALAAAIKRFPQIDSNRLYVAGHSSAATLALQLAAADLGIKACVAMAPIGNFEKQLSASTLRGLDRLSPGASAQLLSRSPHVLAKSIRCPVFLFHAADDTKVRAPTVVELRQVLEAAGVTVTYSMARTGGHYDSMIEEGLPAAVNWLSDIDLLGQRPNQKPEPTR